MPASVVTDTLGYVYTAGTEQTNTNEYEITVIKYDSLGNQQWIAHYDTTGYYSGAVALAISYGTGNVIVTGYSGTAYSSWDFETASYNMSTGATVSTSRVHNGAGAFVSKPVSLAIGVHNCIYVMGAAASTTPGNVDFKLIKYDSLFNQLWVKTWGGPDSLDDEPAYMVINQNLTQLSITGYTTHANGAVDMVTMAYDSGGTLLWNQFVNNDTTTTNIAYGNSVVVDNSTNAYVTGQVFNGSNYDIVTKAYDVDGNSLWQETYDGGGSSNDIGMNVSLDNSDGVYVSGTATTSGISKYITMLYTQWAPTACKYLPCPDISYILENIHLTTTGTDTFAEFDIYAMQNDPTLMYSGASIYFTYSKNVVDSSAITVTKGTIVTNATYSPSLKDTLLKSDAVVGGEGEVCLTIAIAHDTGLYEIPDTFQQLCHVKMKMKGYGNCQVGFDQYYMQNNSNFYSIGNNPYNFVYTGGRIEGLRSGSLNVQIANASYTASPGYLTFDVQAQSDDGDPFYDADVTIGYNTDNFGTDVQSSGNLHCASSTIENSGLYDLTVSGGSNSFEISVDGNGSYDAGYAYDASPPTIPTISAYTTLATCSLTVQNCCYSAGGGNSLTVISVSGEYATVSLVMPDDTDQTTWYYEQHLADYTQGALTGYNSTSGLCISGTTPTILDLSPLQIAAGTFDVLTITGKGFGCSPGQVVFQNADDGGASMMHTQASDIQSWEDNEIRVWVPSIESNATGKTAGSGQIEVITSGSVTSDFSSQSITVPYSALNVRDVSNNPIMVGVINENGTGGYTFTPDTTTMSDTALGTITQAMNDWVCQTGISFKMGASGAGLVTNPTDGINAIFFGNPGAGLLAATSTTVNIGATCYGSSPEVTYISDIDMVISNSTTWDYRNVVTPAGGKVTLLGTIRHEFGHASGIEEVMSGTDLMFWEDLGPGVTALSIENDDQNGGLYELTHVGPNNLMSCYAAINIQSFPPGCPTLPIINGVSNVASDPFNLSAYPNPFDESVTIRGSIDKTAEVRVDVFDILGQRVCSQNYGVQSGALEETLNVSSLSQGAYIMRLCTGEQSIQVKLIKK